MKLRIALALLASFLIASLLAGQGARPADLTGSWTPLRGATPGGRRNVDFPAAERVPFRPEAKAKYDASGPVSDVEGGCVPRGAVRYTMTSMLPLDILQTPQKTIFLFNQHAALRRIYTDGRRHPDNLQATYFGHSIGRWDGTTLVVDTVGENDTTWLNSGEKRLPHSDALHVTERIRLVEDGRYLEIETTIEDPKAYTTSMKVTRYWERTQNVVDPEFVCEDALPQ